MELIINNKNIKGNIVDILKKLRLETGNKYFKVIKPSNDSLDNVLITCPHHKNGQEANPSCYIVGSRKDKDVEFGKVHCFTCNFTSTLPYLVAYCFNKDIEYGNNWLIENFGGDVILNMDLPPIELNNKDNNNFLDESILNNYNYYHPYMWERKLTKEIVDKFKVGYNKLTNSLTFPVWDDRNNLVMITERNINNKNFYIEKGKEKPVYLLNYLINNNITTAYIAESQINALTLQSWGYPGVAMLGGGTKYQYEILKKSGIRNYILCFDGDKAGDYDISNFIKNMPKDILISIKVMPRDGRDINDLTKEQFDSLKIINI